MRIANHVGGCRRLIGLALLGTMLSLAAVSRPARADLLFFKDGFAIEGRVKREMVLEFDKVGREAYHMPKGFFFLDDGPRRIFFSPSQVRFVFEKDPPSEERILCKNPIPGQLKPKRFPGLLEVVRAPEWNPGWSRRFEFRSSNRMENVPQHIALLTPYWARVDSLGAYFWSCAYLTRELGQETVQSLLATHPDFQDEQKQKPEQRASMRLRKADFFAQAGWLDLADSELDRLLEKMPDQKERVEAARKTLFKLRARERLEEIKRRHVGGQHRQVRKLLADFPTKGVPQKQIAELEELKAEYENNDRLVKETARLLERTRRATRSADSKWLDEAAGVICDNLNFENVMRLDAFLGQARQAERLQKKGQKAEVSAEQLLSLAVSGWLLGSASGELSVETARRLWQGRAMLFSYLLSDDDDKRKQIVRRHLSGSRTESASLDELMRIIRTLPPIEAEKKLPNRVTEYKTEGATYHVQMPPEYRHGRPYPVLMVLHQAGEKPQAMLDRWAEPAAEHGYLLVAPEWQSGLNNNYNYTAEEHAVVLNTLKDLRRRFNTDEDRVFLFGLREGAAMAFDVGLAHPDLFAGVLPMSAAPLYHAEICWRNGQYLPFYVVYGNQSLNGDKVREQFNNWILRHFPMLWIEYKGRGVEWYAGEVPNMFDWMRGKRRPFPLRQLGSDGRGGGFGNEFCTLRPGDNHFYWLSCDDVRFTKTLDNWIARARTPPASLTARIDRDDNAIYLNTSGIGQATIWLGRDDKGENMIDFDRPVKVRHGLANMGLPRKVSPSLEVLMEDFAQRGDRRQLFFAKIPLKLLPPKRR